MGPTSLTGDAKEEGDSTNSEVALRGKLQAPHWAPQPLGRALGRWALTVGFENQQGRQLVELEGCRKLRLCSYSECAQTCSESQHREQIYKHLALQMACQECPHLLPSACTQFRFQTPCQGGGPWHASGEALAYAKLWLYCLQPQPLFQGRTSQHALGEAPASAGLQLQPTLSIPLEKPQLMLASAPTLPPKSLGTHSLHRDVPVQVHAFQIGTD